MTGVVDVVAVQTMSASFKAFADEETALTSFGIEPMPDIFSAKLCACSGFGL